ncbi:MAG: hypothetical protein NZM29_02165 [Nitrospira sp.]|nr:hypothetical protein [Nitrospira sp.]
MGENFLQPLRSSSSGQTSLEGKGVQQQRFELLIGSNIFRDTNGVVQILEKEQLVLELRPDEGLLLVTMDLYDEHGARLAHLRRNMFAVNRSRQFEVEVHGSESGIENDPPWVRLFEKQSGLLILEASMASPHRAHIRAGRFYSHRGTLIEITPHYCRLGSQTTLFGEIIEARGGMVILGPNRLRPFFSPP